MPEIALEQSQTIKSQMTRPAEHVLEKAGPVSALDPITSYQQAFGNHAVQRMLHAKMIQAKLVVNPPDDEYEKEADQVADAVMRMPEPVIQRACPSCKEDEAVQTSPLAAKITPLVQRQAVPEEVEGGAVQAKFADGGILQRQEEETEEEEPLQAKPLLSQTVSQLQRALGGEDEEEKIQTKRLNDNIGSIIQRDEVKEENEEKRLQTKPLSVQDSSIKGEAEGEKCRACPKDEEVGPIRRKTASVTVSQIIDERLLQNLGSGQPLDIKTRNFFEPRFGHNFSQVRVHTDSPSLETARSIDARAFTFGHNIGFGGGHYLPDSHEGQKLLAHELAHVIQQTHCAPRTVSRAPTKSGIKKSDYSFSTNCGWIDWGHANPMFARQLIASVLKASEDLKAAGTGAGSSPTMAAKKFGVIFSSASMEATLARPLNADEVLAVSLSMFKNLSVIFEIQQEWTDWFSGSSFSQEDLPSNLISFYRAARGFTADQIKQCCDAKDVDKSLEEYKRNSNFQKNRTFSPVGATGAWPAELSSIDETKGASLYKVTSVSVGSPASGFKFCPLYRVIGTIGETDFFIIGVGGATFSAADNLRVVPTYRVDTDRVSGSGHVPFLEIRPHQQSDADTMKAKGIKAPLYVPSSVLECIGEMTGADVTGNLMRKPNASESETSDAPQIVDETLKGSGEPLDEGTRAFMEPRFGYDFSYVRVHTGPKAAESARAVNARAYTVGNNIVFDRGNHNPGIRESQRLLAHELGHVLQQKGDFLRRDDSAPPANKWDRIAKEVFGYETYDEYLSRGLKLMTFFGQNLSNLNGEMVKKLEQAEKNLKAKQGAATAPHADSILRPRASMHGWGMAIDFNIPENPYVLNERGEGELDKELLLAYDHIAQFMLGDPQSSLRKIKQGRSSFGSGSVGDVYDALRRESDAMRRYFTMKDDDVAITNYITNDWPANHTGKPSPDVATIKAQIKEDYEVLGGKTDKGNKRSTRGKGDRPFAPKSTGGKGDPATGFLNLEREFVLAMTDAGLAWGAIDIEGEPGDIQHFDLRKSGTGARVYSLLNRY